MRSSDIAYEKIKEMILTAKILPGEVINDNELMEKLEMGRTPIREALNRLSWEGQVRIIPRQCIMASHISNKDVDSIYQVRYALSVLEGELVATRRTEEDIQRLEEIVRKTQQETDSEKRVLLDAEFHREMSHITGNTFLENEMNMTLNLCVRLLFLNKEFISSIDNSVIYEYWEIIESIRKQDVETTIQLEQQHLLSFRNKFIK